MPTIQKILLSLAFAWLHLLAEAQSQALPIVNWDTLRMSGPQTAINGAIQLNNRMIVIHPRGVNYSDDGGLNWLKVNGAPRNGSQIWHKNNNVYIIKSQSLNDSIWCSTDNGLSFQFWDVLLSNNWSVRAVITEDTLFYTNYGSKIFKKIRPDNTLQLVYEDNTGNYALQLIEIEGRLIAWGKLGMIWSDDNGQTWTTIQPLPFCDNCNFFSDNRMWQHQNVLFYYNSEKVLMRSFDRGTTWESLSFFQGLSEGGLINVTSEGNDLLATTSGYSYPLPDQVIWRSSDLGLTWMPAYPPVIHGNNYLLNAFITPFGKRLISTMYCYALTDNDQQWAAQTNGLPSERFEQFLKADDDTWLVSTLGDIWRTTNWGKSYQLVLSSKYNIFLNLRQRNGTLFTWPIDSLGLSRSDDNGLTWQNVAPPGQTYVVRTFYEDDAHELVLFSSMDLFRYNHVEGTWQFLSNSPAMGDFPPRPLLLHEGKIFRAKDDKIQVSSDWCQTFTTVPGSLPSYYGSGPLYAINNMLVAPSWFSIYLSDDLGMHWTDVNSSGISPTEGFSSMVSSSNTGLAYTRLYSAWIYATDDAGQSWFKVGPPSTDGNEQVIWGMEIFGDSAFVRLPDYFLKTRMEDMKIQTLSGKVFADTNGNGIQDTTEQPLRGISVVSTNSHQLTLTDIAGNYVLALNGSSDSIYVVPPYPHYTSTPIGYKVDQATGDLNFGLFTDYRDLAITLGSGQLPRPGFEYAIQAQVSNAGLNTENGVVKIHLAPNLQVLSTVPPASLVGDTLVWQGIDLAALAVARLTINCRLDSTTALGTWVSSTGTVAIEGITDNFPDNNYSTLDELVVGSYDPNDKIAEIGDAVHIGSINTNLPLGYTIRFQNTGTLPADFVRIRDTLSAAFDLSTFRFESASHPVRVSVVNPNILDFYFPNIQLADSTTDEVGSHGFVRFTIAAKNDLSIGDLITNRAGIYFDYNAPVITPYAVTKVIDSTSLVRHFLGAQPLTIQPNLIGTHQSAYVLFPKAAQNQAVLLQVFGKDGRLVKHDICQSGAPGKQIEGLHPGVYRVFVTVGGQKYLGTIVCQ